MNCFDVKIETGYSDNEKVRRSNFSMTFLSREHSLPLGYYVIYPDAECRQLVLMPKHKFDEYINDLNELVDRINGSVQEKIDGVKPRNRQYTTSHEDIGEAKKLRGIVTNSISFSIRGYETTINMPGKFLSMLRIDDDYLTFVPTGRAEFLIVNPTDAWQFSDSSSFNTYYSENDTRTIFHKIKRAI